MNRKNNKYLNSSGETRHPRPPPHPSGFTIPNQIHVIHFEFHVYFCFLNVELIFPTGTSQTGTGCHFEIRAVKAGLPSTEKASLCENHVTHPHRVCSILGPINVVCSRSTK
jgi:hypothetical protein